MPELRYTGDSLFEKYWCYQIDSDEIMVEKISVHCLQRILINRFGTNFVLFAPHGIFNHESDIYDYLFVVNSTVNKLAN